MASTKKVATGLGFLLVVVFGFALAGGSPEAYMPMCMDGIDNDGDGLADNQDDGCRLVTGVSDEPGSPPPSIYCPTWDDETSPPTQPEDCE